MQSWIFQANPKRVDVEEFFETHPSALTWRVSRHADQMRIGDRVYMRIGDRVYIWRAAAGEKEKAGVIAEAVISSSVASIASGTIGAEFWFDEDEAQSEADRVWLKVIRIGSSREQLRREWLKEDPVLSDMLILKQPAATNFLSRLESRHSEWKVVLS